MLAKCRRCGVNGDHAVGAIRGVFYPCPHAHHCPLPATGSGRKRGTQPPTPVLCTSPGVAARVLGGGTGLKPRATEIGPAFFFGGGGVGPSLSLSLSVSVSLFVCLSLFLRPVCVRLRVYHLFLGGWFFPPTIVPAPPRKPCGWCDTRFFFFRVPTPTTAHSGTGSGRKRNGGDMLAKCRHGLDYGWYACKMQALWGILEDMLAKMQVRF